MFEKVFLVSLAVFFCNQQINAFVIRRASETAWLSNLYLIQTVDSSQQLDSPIIVLNYDQTKIVTTQNETFIFEKTPFLDFKIKANNSTGN